MHPACMLVRSEDGDVGMQDWLVPLARIMERLEATPEGKRFHYPIRHGSMRVGIYAPDSAARPAKPA